MFAANEERNSACPVTRHDLPETVCRGWGGNYSTPRDLGDQKMKSIKLALLGGAALAVSAAAAHADDLDALKAQIEALNARVATMEAAPAVPAGYSLLTISEGDMKQIPGLQDSNDRALRALGPKATVISVLPTADAPAGATVTWSGRVVASLTYYHADNNSDVSFSNPNDAIGVFDFLTAVTQRLQRRRQLRHQPRRLRRPRRDRERPPPRDGCNRHGCR